MSNGNANRRALLIAQVVSAARRWAHLRARQGDHELAVVEDELCAAVELYEAFEGKLKDEYGKRDDH